MIPSTHDETKKAYESELLSPPPNLTEYGDYNAAPEPMVTTTAEEYSRRLIYWQVVAIESRQPKTLGYSTLCIHWLNTGNGVGLSRVWVSGPNGGAWTPVYWLIGCKHGNMSTIKISNHLYERVCQDCGHRTTVDTSG